MRIRDHHTLTGVGGLLSDDGFYEVTRAVYIYAVPQSHEVGEELQRNYLADGQQILVRLFDLDDVRG